MASFNDRIIEEFRANEGRVGGMFEGAPMLLLTTTGRRSGEPRVSPLVYTRDGGGYVIAASKAGADTHPAWYRNIEASPDVRVEIGTEAFPARARIADGAERDRLWEQHVAAMPNFRDYERKTSRVIPMVVLERP